MCIPSIVLAQPTAEYIPFVRESGFLGQDWYRRQAALWQQQTTATPADATAWRNYYLATEYSYFGSASPDKREKLAAIISAMRQRVPDAPETLYLRYRFDQSDDAALLEAQRRAPDLPEPYYDLVVRSELNGDATAFRQQLAQLYRTADIPAALLDYNYNMLMSCEEGAILLTNGDNDTYPAWVLQQAKGIRNDVSVWNAHLLRVSKDYLLRKVREKVPGIQAGELPSAGEADFLIQLVQLINTKAAQIPVYFAVTIDQKILKPLNKQLFLTGLAYRHSDRRIDNIKKLQQNWQQFRLDYVTHDWNTEADISRPLVDKLLNQNYLPAAIILFETALKNGEETQAAGYRQFILEIAEKAGVIGDVKQQLQKIDG